MKRRSALLAGLLLGCILNAQAGTSVDAIRQRMGLSDNGILVEGKTTVYLIGEITPGLAAAFANAATKGPAIDTVIVDSPGGDMASAIDIAALIHQRHMQIVVDGRCFSACANYLFPAGRAKSVRPHSFVGIHQRTYNVRVAGGVLQTTRPDDILVRGNSGAPMEAARAMAALRKKEAAFLRTVQYSSSLDDAFTAYLRRYERAIAAPAAAAGSQSCPRIKLWVLRREQLAAIGLKNMAAFWEPRTAEEQRLLAVYFKVPASESFFGTEAALNMLCQGA